jgi:hypothetical protein
MPPKEPKSTLQAARVGCASALAEASPPRTRLVRRGVLAGSFAVNDLEVGFW